MQIYDNENHTITLADAATKAEVLALPFFQQQVSLWQGCGTGKGFYFKYDTSLKDLLEKLTDYSKLHLHERALIDSVKQGILKKADSFGFCVSTFPVDEDGKIRRLKNKYSTFTKLVTLDIDLYNSPDYSDKLLSDFQAGLYEEALGIGRFIFLSGKSISGKGLYLYLLCDSEDTQVLEVVVEKLYEHINAYFRFQNEKEVLDRSAKDIINRVRYFAPDENLIINPYPEAIDTSTTKKKLYQSKNTTSTSYTPVAYASLAGDVYKEQLEIQWYYNKHLSGYSTTAYHTGLHIDFLKFANACMFKGVSKEALIEFTTATYKNLHNPEKGAYLDELLRNIDCAQDNVKRQSK